MAEHTIYAVGDGEYEQYGIVVAFTSQALAEDAVRKHIGTEVEEITVLDQAPKRVHCYMYDGLLNEATLEVAWIKGRDWASWDYDVPDTPGVRTAAWAAGGGPHIFAEVRGRERKPCRQLIEQTLTTLAEARLAERD